MSDLNSRIAARTAAARPTTQIKRQPGDIQNLSEDVVSEGDSGSRGKIYGLATNKTPEQVANDNAAREKSLRPDSPNYNPNPEAQKNLAQGQFEDLLDATKIKKTDPIDDQFTSAANDNPSTEQNNDSQTFLNNPEEQYQLPLDIPDEYNIDRINKIRSELKSKMNINLSVGDTTRLTKMNLKVTSGISMFVVIMSDFTVEITGLLISAFFTVVGLGTNAIPIPFLNFLVGGTVSAIGFSVGIGTFLISSILSLFFIYIVARYQRTCSEIFEIAEIRKAAHDRYIWLWALGYMIPFIGNFGQLLRAIIEPIRKGRFVKQISKIVSTK
jgi:hypothetical protein